MATGGSVQTEILGVGNAPNVSTEPSNEEQPRHELACLACGEVHPAARLVALEYGGQVGNYSETWRRHCEARWVLKNKRTKNTRQAYLAAVIEQRGEPAARELREEMRKIWLHRQGK